MHVSHVIVRVQCRQSTHAMRLRTPRSRSEFDPCRTINIARAVHPNINIDDLKMSTTTHATIHETFFTRLPPEIREHIYTYLFPNPNIVIIHPEHWNLDVPASKFYSSVMRWSEGSTSSNTSLGFTENARLPKACAHLCPPSDHDFGLPLHLTIRGLSRSNNSIWGWLQSCRSAFVPPILCASLRTHLCLQLLRDSPAPLRKHNVPSPHAFR